jgi:hypothetical protein
VRLEGGPDATTFDTVLEGPYDRRPRTERGFPRLSIPLRLRRGGPDDPVTVEVAGQTDAVRPGERGRWLSVRFEFPNTFPRVSVAGRVRFQVRSARPELVVLSSPVQIDPSEPILPISSPPALAAELEERYGPYKTQGWMEETFQLNDGNTTEEAFLEDLLSDMDQTAAMLRGEMRRSGARLVAAVFTQTDRATHCFYRLRDREHPAHDAALAARLGDPIREVYRRMDRIVGSVVDLLEEDDVLLLVSDHGFQTWRRGMNVNAFLREQGFLSVRGSPEWALDDFFAGRVSDAHVDWSRTRAYAMGLGQVYLNLRGREPEGIVSPEEAPALLDDLRRRFLEYRDEATGERPLVSVHLLRSAYAGPLADEAAELQLGFGPGWRISWQTALLGGVEGPVCEDNLHPWSGDHCSTDRALVPGVLLSNRRIPAPPPDRPYGVKDVAATALAHFGLDTGDLEGRPIPIEAPTPPR